ncbi:MAG TPA: bifunctional oligoribonuclease/PAP phosphatase NrnA [Muribaculum sp.]|jgi:phosphoesterase RecJ-like protein|uniref:Bifunctional oligoribonuclease/PAP phosphatase NrnA n=1 Tax=Heminiphilus faecis TaxID=2601703 RepID=A0ABV4CX22_9BACT|nr:bifunctional oligoribonuclease/PAP phosphatase NrnA [Heminiphilus faecis]RLT75531.1 bifunctional oligoribonuclease/PAP phosphatase NrnA [bacterium J10(2018)]HRF68898.1 bifunctional oligoribonuclease/PAP phosphatase NrnA [Muribaculum sp.]
MLRPIIAESDIKAVRDLLEESERIVITCHMAPDGDAVGSSLGLSHTLANIGKEARIVTPDRIPETLRFLPGAKDIVPYSKYTDFATKLLEDADLIFCLDFNALYRVDRMSDALSCASAKKILVDHHESPQDFTDVVISHPDQSSTSALIFRLLCRLELFNMIDRKAAACIYTGMMTDTGNFSYNSNDPDLYTIIAELVRKGINKDDIYKRVMNTKKANVLKLNGYAVSRMEIFEEHKAALLVLSADDLKNFNYERGDTEGLVNEPLAIEDVIYSVFLREDDRHIKVSTRSKGDFPVNRICERYFNGGGHVNAAGGELPCSLDEAIDIFKSTLTFMDEYLKEKNQR